MSVLGLDIGTSGCKAVAFSAEGDVLASAARTYALRHPQPGWSELDAEDVWRNCAACIRESAIKSSSPVQALSISSQGEAFVAVDEQGAALSPAMVSSDIRASNIVTRAVRAHGTDFFYQRTGHTPHPLFSLFKLLWMRQHQPQVWRSARQFLCFEDFAHRKLGVDPAISWPMAGRTMLFDTGTDGWNSDLLTLVGITPERLARPLPSGAMVGAISSIIAKELGLAVGCKVITGGHDQVAAALGAGVAAPGQALYAMGSVECMVVVSDHYRLADGLREANLCSYDHVVSGCHTHLAYNLTGSNLLAWYRDQFASGAKPETGSVYDWMFRQMPKQPTDLLVLPYFTATGTPHFDAYARGAILGLEFRHNRFDILRAMVEGLALEMRLNLELLAAQGIGVDQFRATGGGTRNRSVLQIKADVLRTPITPTLESEGGCLATAMLAQAALDQRPVQDYLPQWVKLGETVQPNSATRSAYDEAYGRYQQLYRTLKPVLRPR